MFCDTYTSDFIRNLVYKNVIEKSRTPFKGMIYPLPLFVYIGSKSVTARDVDIYLSRLGSNFFTLPEIRVQNKKIILVDINYFPGKGLIF